MFASYPASSRIPNKDLRLSFLSSLRLPASLGLLSLSFSLCRYSSMSLLGPRAHVDLFAFHAASLFLAYVSNSHLHAETCNSGPYESTTATHVTSAYRHRNQRIPFVTLRPPRAYFIAYRSTKISRMRTYITAQFAFVIVLPFGKSVMMNANILMHPLETAKLRQQTAINSAKVTSVISAQ